MWQMPLAGFPGSKPAEKLRRLSISSVRLAQVARLHLFDKTRVNLRRVKRSIAIAALLLTLPVSAQEFEVASVRPHAGPLHSIMDLEISGPRVTLGAYNIAQLVVEAYHLKGMWQISFANFPGSDEQKGIYYDIVARASGNSSNSREEFRKMLRALLADRFKLSFHRELKQTPVYALIPGKNTSKLKKHTGDGDCAVHVSVVTGGQSYEFSNCSIERLVSAVGDGLVDRPVVDRTGLTGEYDMRFVVTPAFMRQNQPELADISPFSAIQELGLKLQAQSEPMEILVVDHFEKPSAN
jgi:uncharacterized protein (TIGR03435 family)